MNFRASYAQETLEMVRGLTRDLGIKPSEIGFFTQNDAYGDAGYAGAVTALKAAGYADAERLPHARYPRNTVDVENAVAQLLDPTVHVRAIIVVGAYKPAAKFIRLARRHGLHALFVHVSFVIGDQLREELGADAEGVVVTQVVPPISSNLPAIAEYRDAMACDERGFVSLEGFLAARAFVDGLRRAGPELTREKFIEAFESAGAIDLGIGETALVSETDHQLSDRVWPTVIKNGKFHLLSSWKELRP